MRAAGEERCFMKYYFQNTEAVKDALEILAEDLGMELSGQDTADIQVEVCRVEGHMLAVKLDGKNAGITYGGGLCRFNRALAILAGWVKEGKSAGTIVENPLFHNNGAMIDMSRNAVMNVKTVKFMMRKMALMGMNTYMLYTEDTYEIDKRPYFGYMRGRYTKEEIREMDAYAIKLGIELIPCIQLLGHLATHLKWAAAASYKDTARALLVGEKATYDLVDDMLKNIAECFTSRRLHMGMDETHDLGTGTYLEKYGYRERRDLYLEHLKKVTEIAKFYGFKPMMWSDMFFRLAGKGLERYGDYDMRVEMTEEIGKLVPEGIQQVFWDYYHPDEEFYAVNIEKHKRYLTEDIMFAGGVWLWSSHAPHYGRSLRNTIPALDACRKAGVKEVLGTVWLNGSEACLVMSLAGLAWYADYDYRGGYDPEGVKECFRFSCDAEYDDFIRCEQVEHPDHGDLSTSRAFLYTDPLAGLMDKQIEGLDTQSYYKALTPELQKAAEGKGEFAPAIDVIVKLSAFLENKADLGVRLNAAYDAGEKEALAALAKECDVAMEKLTALKDCHRAAWMRYNKAFGWEVHDIRYGGIMNRLATAKYLVQAYLAGEIEEIEELAAERKRMDCRPDDTEERFDGREIWTSYAEFATVNIL